MTAQLDAERGHVLIELIFELGGLAHQDQDAAELDTLVDSMLSKGFPNVLSNNLLRWIHTHRSIPGFKIHSILGAHVNKTSSIIPECFGKFHDPTAVECKACLDRTLCRTKTNSKVTDGDGPKVTTLYQIGRTSNTMKISEILVGKSGQIAKTLSHGNRVIMTVKADKLQLLTVDGDNSSTGDDLTESNIMAKGTPAKKAAVKATPAKKAAAAVAIDEEEVDLNLEATDGAEEAEDAELDEEAEGEAEEEAEEGEEEEEAEEDEEPEAKPVKVKKAPKPKPVLNKGQQEFQAELDKRTGADKQKYSAKIAKDLKLKVEAKGDDRIDHMLRTMAIKKHLGAIGGPAKKAVVKK